MYNDEVLHVTSDEAEFWDKLEEHFEYVRYIL
jgi:hypothetical protein